MISLLYRWVGVFIIYDYFLITWNLLQLEDFAIRLDEHFTKQFLLGDNKYFMVNLFYVFIEEAFPSVFIFTVKC